MRAYYDWMGRVQHGARRAPLELIAYVVENDRPYTEILTADYIMANPWSALAYGASTRFDDPTDVHEFRPSKIVKYYRTGEGFESEYDSVVQATRVLDPGPLITTYPHAGILNTTVFLRRYPTTATNRNRARARWTYYHFLGLDVEKSASRTTDPVALADTSNPTMHNPACTVCHSVLDPLAGAFQNYGDDGFYRDQWGGLDSLDEFYKYDAPGRRDVPVNQRSREEGATALGTVRLFADSDNELGLKNLRTFEGDTKLHLGLGEVVVRTLNGDVVDRYQTRDAAADEACGGAPNSEGYILWDCREMLVLPLIVQRDGDYSVEIEVWVWEAGEKAATLQVWMPGPFYQEGDTWYHDMRTPGFAGELASDSDNSLQWLAKQIVADRLVVVMGSDFGRTNFYNAGDGKDHWPIGSYIVMEKNQTWTNRVVGETDELHFAYRIDPRTLRRDDQGGTSLYPKHIHKALRRYLGIEHSWGAQRFPFHNTEDCAFFT